MTCDSLILNVAVANFHDGTRRYYTFDHRRLWCMYQAGCQRIRVRVIMQSKVFDAFAKKADGLGRRLTDLRVRGRV